MCGSMVGIQSVAAENRPRKKEEERRNIETTAAKYNDLPYWAATITTDNVGCPEHKGL